MVTAENDNRPPLKASRFSSSEYDHNKFVFGGDARGSNPGAKRRIWDV
jgi:hypothetical protein